MLQKSVVSGRKIVVAIKLLVKGRDSERVLQELVPVLRYEREKYL